MSNPTPLELLVRDFLNAKRSEGLSIKTIETYRPRLERQFLPWAAAEGITEVAQVDKRAIERYSAYLRGNGGHLRKDELSPFTVNSYLRTINVLLAWAKKEGEQVNAKAKLARQPQRIIET